MSVTRTYGLSGSGIDVDSMVTKLMAAARTPYNTLVQKQTVQTWKKEEYNKMYTSINEFNNTTVFNFNKQSTLSPKSVISSDTSVATVTSKSDAANVNHTLKVTQLASGVTESSSAAITTGTSKTTMASQFGISGSFDIKINGKSVTVSSSASINDFVSKINNASAGVTATYDTTADRFYLYTNSTGASSSIDFTGSSTNGLAFLSDNLKISASSLVGSNGITSAADTGATSATDVLGTVFSGLTGTLNFNISDGTTSTAISVASTGTIQDILDKINAAKDSSGNTIATASFTNGKFTLKANNSDTTLEFSGSDTNTTSFLNNRLKLTNKTGQDAQIKLDGVSMTESSNKFTIAGVTYNALSTGSTTIGITSDVTSAVASVKAFVAAYNTMLSSLYSEVKETRYTDYTPLTDEQKSAMKDTDISLWTVKAKSGMLHNDSILKTVGESMRTAFTSAVSGLTGNYKTAASLGITTSNDYTDNGKIYLDETVLTTALQADPNAAYKVFGTTGTTTATNGIATRLSTIMKTAAASIVKEAGATASTTADITSTVGRNIYELTERMSTMSDFLADEESRYYTKFNAMETALAKLTAQSSSLASLLGGS